MFDIPFPRLHGQGVTAIFDHEQSKNLIEVVCDINEAPGN
jgi:hypothetical protein